MALLLKSINQFDFAVAALFFEDYSICGVASIFAAYFVQETVIEQKRCDFI